VLVSVLVSGCVGDRVCECVSESLLVSGCVAECVIVTVLVSDCVSE
jgi:hypothetical protein